MIFTEHDKRSGRSHLVVSKYWPDGTRFRRRCPSRRVAKNFLRLIEERIASGTWREFRNELRIDGQNGIDVGKKHGLNSMQVTAGYVYVVRVPNGPYKIGCTCEQTPEERIQQINDVLPDPARLIVLLKTETAGALETQLHFRFASKRRRGEWFDLSDGDVQEILSMDEVISNRTIAGNMGGRSS